MRQLNGHAPGKCHIAFPIKQSLRGIMHRHQRGGTRSLHVDGGTFQIKYMTDPCGKEILIVSSVAQ